MTIAVAPTPILFLDLDGTVRFNGESKQNFITNPTEVEIFPGVADRMKEYKTRGWRIVAVSNQGGISCGFLEESMNSRIMNETNRMCGSLFDKMMWCPHHEGAGLYKVNKGKTEEEILELQQCFCRKPKAGMPMLAVAMLQSQHPTEYYRPYACLFVGDRPEDEICSMSLGIPFMFADVWRSGKHQL